MSRAIRYVLLTLSAILCSLPAGLGAAGGQSRPPATGITVYADADFRGESANFRSDVSDLTRYRMNDIVSSLRVAPGETWEACVDKDFKGRCQVFNGSEPDLTRTGWSDVITSLRRVRNVGPVGRGDGEFGGRPQVRARITLYDRTDFRGATQTLTSDSANLGRFNNKAASVRVEGGGNWELCDGPRWTGRCVAIRDDVRDLSRVGLENRVTSVRLR